MNVFRYLFVLAVFLAGCSPQNKNREPITAASFNIVPLPASITPGNDLFALEGNIAISAKSEDEKNVAGFLVEFLKSKNINASVVDGSGTINISTINVQHFSLAFNRRPGMAH